MMEKDIEQRNSKFFLLFYLCPRGNIYNISSWDNFLWGMHTNETPFSITLKWRFSKQRNLDTTKKVLVA
jgi:hypothetical protein